MADNKKSKLLERLSSRLRVKRKGSVRRDDRDDEKLIGEIDANFMDLDFDSFDYVMKGLPDEVTMEYLIEKSHFYKERCDAVERSFKKKLMDNSHSFIVGMQQIQDVKLDLLLTHNLCTRARRSLTVGDRNLVHKCFGVMATYQRRKRLVDALQILYDIRRLKEREGEFHSVLQSNDFLTAIQYHTEITSAIFGKYANVECLELMRKRFGDGTKMITDKLSDHLLSLIFSAPQIDHDALNVILTSYHKLDQFHSINGLLEDCCIRVLRTKCTQIICHHLGHQKAYIERNYGLFAHDPLTPKSSPNTNNSSSSSNHYHQHRRSTSSQSQFSKKSVYRKLCGQLKVGHFMSSFMDICGRTFDILHSYYKIESVLIKFRMDHHILSEDMNIVRKELWLQTQMLLGGVLESSQFDHKTKIKMEDLLLALHGASIFKSIGQSFSGSDSAELARSIRLKCNSYLDHFRKTFFESIKTNFDNEMWVVLPIPSNFGIHSIKELQRNTQWTLIGNTDDGDPSSSTSNSKNSKNKKKNKGNLKREHDEEMNIYQKFLSGDNIFDRLLDDKRRADAEKKSKPSNIFDDADNNRHRIARPSDDGTEPCITSTSLNLAKFIGRCLQIMESLHPVSFDAFEALKGSFTFYLYHVFIWFGVNVHNFFELHESDANIASALTRLGGDNNRRKTITQQREEKLKQEQEQKQRNIMAVAQKKYPVLTKVINKVNEELGSRKLAPELEDLIKEKLGNRIRRPPRLPHYAKCYMEASEGLQLKSQSTMQGVAARFVATETLTFLVNVIKSQHGRLINILRANQQSQSIGNGGGRKRIDCGKEVSSFIRTIENVVGELKQYMYRNVPTLLVHLGSADNRDSIISHINATNWNIKSLTTEHNGYVDELIEIFSRIETVLSSFPTLPKFIHNRLNKEAIIYVEEQLVDVFADCKRCTTEGRALMSLDQSELKKSYPICKYKHSWEYTTNFIQAYYLPREHLMEWIQAHPEYPLKAHKSFLRVGRASEGLKRRERVMMEEQIGRVVKESKLKQKKKLQQAQKEMKDKPNLAEIHQTMMDTQNVVKLNGGNHSNATMQSEEEEEVEERKEEIEEDDGDHVEQNGNHNGDNEEEQNADCE